MYENKAREILANNIKYYRNLCELSQEKLAELLDTSTCYISELENCKRNIQIDNIGKIADILDVPIQRLFSEKNKKDC